MADNRTSLNPNAPEYRPIQLRSSAAGYYYNPPAPQSIFYQQFPRYYCYYEPRPSSYFVYDSNPSSLSPRQEVSIRRAQPETRQAREYWRPVERGSNSSSNNNDGDVGFRRDGRASRRGLRRHGFGHPVTPLRRGGNQTSVMIKNVPYHCTRRNLMEFLDRFCAKVNAEDTISAAYDFLYIPFDFRSNNGRGFAFVNFTNPQAAWRFLELHDRRLLNISDNDDGHFIWQKPMGIVAANLQGKEALLEHFSTSTFDCETDEFLPVSFEPGRDGSNRAVEMKVVGTRSRRGYC